MGREIDKKTFKELYRDRLRDQQTINRKNLPYNPEGGIRKYTKKAKKLLEQGIGKVGSLLGAKFMDDYTTKSRYINDPSFPKQNQRADQLTKDIKNSGYYLTKEEQKKKMSNKVKKQVKKKKKKKKE